MKLLLENWRKLVEGEVIDFPSSPAASEEPIQRVIKFEGDVAELLAAMYGNQAEIPVEVIDQLEALVDAVERTLK
jgi:hypothetical protein